MRENAGRTLQKLLVLVPTDEAPSVIDARDLALVNGVANVFAKVHEERPVHVLTLEDLGLALGDHFLAQPEDLVDELLAHSLEGEPIEVLQVSLLSRGTHHHKAVFLLEEPVDDPSYSVFTLDHFGTALFLGECVLKIRLRSNLVPVPILQPQREVS